MSALDEVVGRLADKTPDEIADVMRRAGIRGRRCSAKRCPIANWVVLQIPQFGGVVVGTATVSVLDPSRHLISATLPNSVASFISRFDAREYPDLIAAYTRADQ